MAGFIVPIRSTAKAKITPVTRIGSATRLNARKTRSSVGLLLSAASGITSQTAAAPSFHSQIFFSVVIGHRSAIGYYDLHSRIFASTREQVRWPPTLIIRTVFRTINCVHLQQHVNFASASLLIITRRQLIYTKCCIRGS